jgi:hypothetical protein
VLDSACCLHENGAEHATEIDKRRRALPAIEIYTIVTEFYATFFMPHPPKNEEIYENRRSVPEVVIIGEIT